MHTHVSGNIFLFVNQYSIRVFCEKPIKSQKKITLPKEKKKYGALFGNALHN
jgi:hypothetical protein